MTNTKLSFLATTLFLLSGCGGGAGDETDTPAPVAEPPPTPVSETASAASIDVPTDFDFSTSKPLELQVELNGAVPTKTYLTVCRTLDADGSSNYDECLWRAPVDAGQYRGELQVPNDVEALSVTLWSFSPASVIRSAVWERPGNSGDALPMIRLDN